MTSPTDDFFPAGRRAVRFAALAMVGVLTAGLAAGCGTREDDSVGVEGDDDGIFSSRQTPESSTIEPRQAGPDFDRGMNSGDLNEELDGAVGTDARGRGARDGARDRDARAGGARGVAGGTQELTFPVHGAVSLEATAPAQARVGEAFNYGLTVTNNAGVPAHDVVVIAYQGEDAEPEQIWDVGYLAPGASESREFEIVAEDVGNLGNCLAVEFTPTLCLNTAIVQPQLALTKAGPAEALFCDQFQYTYTVTNDGSGAARNVVITDDLPDGLTVVGGGNDVRIDVGTLAGGESQTRSVTVEANEVGTYSSRAQAASGDLEVNSGEVETAIREAEFALDVEGPDATYVGTPVDYRLVVRNTGDAATGPAELSLALQGGGESLESVTVPGLQPGDQKVYNIQTVAGNRSGDMTLRATVEAPCAKAEDVVATVDTEIRAISALQLEVIDTQDPVRVGDTTDYVITVLNEGSQVEDNVSLSGELPETLEFVSGVGSSAVTGEGQTVTIAATSIEPGEEAKYTVTVRAVGDGQGQFELKLSAPTLSRDAVEDEPTRAFDPGSIRRRAQ